MSASARTAEGGPEDKARELRGYFRGSAPEQRCYAPKAKDEAVWTSSFALGESCRPDLNRLMPWIDKMWALHPYFPDLVKERDLKGAVLL